MNDETARGVLMASTTEAPIVIFHDELDKDAHESFQAWRRENSEGVFINCKSNRNWMIHRVNCWHLGSTEWMRDDFDSSLTKFQKVFSASIQELLEWAGQHGSAMLTGCSHCLPPGIFKSIRQTHELVRLPEEVPEGTVYPVGSVCRILVNRYERDPRARQACEEIYGTKCSVCGFDFRAVYGEVMADFIVVHHIRPLSSVEKGYVVDPVRDLRPVCPNCHAVVHHRREATYSLEEVREFLQHPGKRRRS